MLTNLLSLAVAAAVIVLVSAFARTERTLDEHHRHDWHD